MSFSERQPFIGQRTQIFFCFHIDWESLGQSAHRPLTPWYLLDTFLSTSFRLWRFWSSGNATIQIHTGGWTVDRTLWIAPRCLPDALWLTGVWSRVGSHLTPSEKAPRFTTTVTWIKRFLKMIEFVKTAKQNKKKKRQVPGEVGSIHVNDDQPPPLYLAAFPMLMSKWGFEKQNTHCSSQLHVGVLKITSCFRSETHHFHTLTALCGGVASRGVPVLCSELQLMAGQWRSEIGHTETSLLFLTFFFSPQLPQMATIYQEIWRVQPHSRILIAVNYYRVFSGCLYFSMEGIVCTVEY